MNKEQDNKPLQSLRVVPDTSIIIEGFLSRKIIASEINPSEVLIHEAVLAELESQANKNKETGYLGLEEIKKIRELSEQNNFKILFKGNRPTEFEIKHAKTGEIDSLIRNLASEQKATLITADKVQALVAQSRGIDVILFTFLEEENVFILDKYFDEQTYSVSIKENCPVIVKKGNPGFWNYEEAAPIKDKETVKALAKEIIEEAISSEYGFIESEKKGSTILQYKENKILITRPPLTNSYEIICTRMIKKLKLEDYNLSKKVVDKIDSSNGILIVSSSGDGKTCFSQAIAKHYVTNGKVVKIIESPRNEKLTEEITQLSLNQSSSVEISDIIMLSKPDLVIFDEIKSNEDFRLFTDLRLSGFKVVGLLSASDLEMAIQRLLSKIDFDLFNNLIDAFIFIKEGKIEKTFNISIENRIINSVDNSNNYIVLKNVDTDKKELEIRKIQNNILIDKNTK